MNETIVYVLTSAVFFPVLTAGAVFARASGLTDRTAKALPFSVFALMALEYLFSACGLMQAGPFFLLGLSAGLWLLAAVKSLRAKKKLLDAGLLWFALVYAALCFGNFGRRVQFADEFNHWAAVVKVMCEQGLLSSSAAANLSHASYPPAMAMLQYIPERLMRLFGGSRVYSEQYLYLAIQSAAATVPFCMASRLEKGMKPLQKAVYAALFTLSLFPFAPRLLRFLMIDGYMGLVFGLGAVLILEAVPNRSDALAFALLCFVLTLLKNTGALYAALLCLTAFFALKGEKRTMPLFGAGATALAYLSWKLLLKLGGAVSKFDLNAGMLSGKGAFLKELLGRYLSTTLKTPLFASDALLPAPFFLAFFLLGALALMLKRRSGAPRRAAVVFGMLLLSALVLYLALPFAYAFLFPEADAMRSWDRYLAMPLSAALLTFTFAVSKAGAEKTGRGRALLAALFALLLCWAPYKEPARFFTRHEARQSAAFAKAFDAAAETVSALPADAKLMVVEEEGANGNEKHALRYLLLPRTVEFVDAGGKGHYQTATGAATEAEALLAHMRENGFTHLFVYTAGSVFPDEFAAAFQNGAIENGALYALEDGLLRRA